MAGLKETIVLKGVDYVIRIVESIAGTKKEKIAALSQMQKAVNATRIFLKDNLDDRKNYKPNEKLSALWLGAFEAIHKFDMELAERLRYKSNFWANPQRWLKEPGALEMVPKLKELDEYIEGKLAELKNS